MSPRYVDVAAGGIVRGFGFTVPGVMAAAANVSVEHKGVGARDRRRTMGGSRALSEN